jgi:hypothetical protein
LRRRRGFPLADGNALDLTDQLDGLADDSRLEDSTIFPGETRHRRGLDRNAEIGRRAEILLAVEIEAVARLGGACDLELEQRADRLGRS